MGWIANTGASISASYVNLDAEHSQGGSVVSVSNKRLVGGRANTHALVENKVYGKTTAELKALTAAGTGWSTANWSFAALPGVLYVQNPSTAANAPKWCGAEGNSDELPVCGTLIPGQRLSATIAGGGACTARDLKDWQDGVCEKTKMGQTRTCTDGTEGDGSCDWSCLGVAVKKWRIDVSCVACKARTLTEWADGDCNEEEEKREQTRTCTPGQKGNGGCTWSCAGITESQLVDDDDCKKVTVGACTDRTFTTYSRSNSCCSSGQRRWTRTCTPGNPGDKSCEWSCVGATTRECRTDSSCVYVPPPPPKPPVESKASADM